MPLALPIGKQALFLAACAVGALSAAGCGSKAEHAQSPPPPSLSEPIRVEEKNPAPAATVVPADEYAFMNKDSKPLPAVTVETPPKAEEQPAAVTSATGGKTYTMQKGDTLYAIARKFNVPPKQLLAANNFKDPNKLPVGTQVRIP